MIYYVVYNMYFCCQEHGDEHFDINREEIEKENGNG